MNIKYPNGQKNQIKVSKTKTYGMLFENALNISNEYYRLHNIAFIYKKPTPIQVVKVSYPKRSQAKIIEAYYTSKSTTDYNGIYKGRYIDYEAKETHNMSFDFKHIFPHQIEHLNNISAHGGIGFIIIYFKKVDQVYIMDIKNFNNLYEASKKDQMKSISIEIFKKIGIEVKKGYTPPIDYLQAVDQLYNLS